MARLGIAVRLLAERDGKGEGVKILRIVALHIHPRANASVPPILP
jgi:hypothetical protein